jgi:hypothetical protein
MRHGMKAAGRAVAMACGGAALAPVEATGNRSAMGDALGTAWRHGAAIGAALDAAFPSGASGFTCSQEGDASADGGPVAPASGTWSRHARAAINLWDRIDAIHRSAAKSTDIAMAAWSGPVSVAVEAWHRARAGDHGSAARLVGARLGLPARARADDPEGLLHALAHRAWHMRAWLVALELATLLDPEADRVHEPLSSMLGALLAPGAEWASLSLDSCGTRGGLAIHAPGGTVDVRGTQWPAPGGDGSPAGTDEPLRLAWAAGSRHVAITGVDGKGPACAFTTRSGHRVSVGVTGRGVETVRGLARDARFGSERGATFSRDGFTGRAWSSDHDGGTLHARIDRVASRIAVDA